MNGRIPIAIGRSLLALYFLLPGILKLVAWDTHVELMNKHGMILVPVLLASAAAIQISAGISLLLNRYVLVSALVLAGLTLAISFNLHDFWNLSGVEAAHEQQNFVKNLAIFAGLLLLAGMDRNSESISAP